jgi:hypothetical protein
MDVSPTVRTPPRAWRFAAGAMWILSVLFSLRVLGQAVQRCLPQPWLPPFAAWQGSSTPYPLLLSIQLVILGAMATASHGAWHGCTIARRGAVKWVAGLGAIYMTIALARIAIGIGIEAAPAWFRAWISGAFHVVLAAFLLASAGYHFLRKPARATSQ